MKTFFEMKIHKKQIQISHHKQTHTPTTTMKTTNNKQVFEMIFSDVSCFYISTRKRKIRIDNHDDDDDDSEKS